MANRSNFNLPTSSSTREVVRDISGERARILQDAYLNFIKSVEGNLAPLHPTTTVSTERMFTQPVQPDAYVPTISTDHLANARRSIDEAFETTDTMEGGQDA